MEIAHRDAQISVNDVQMFGSLAEGLEVVCKIVARYAAIERLYLRQATIVEKLLEDAVIALYASILIFFSKCRKFFDQGLGQRIARSIKNVPEHIADKHLNKIVVNDRNITELTRIVDAERAQLSVAQQSSMTDKIDNFGNRIETLQIRSRESTSKLEDLIASFQSPLVRTVGQILTLTESLAQSQINDRFKIERLEILQWLSTVQYKKHHQSVSRGLLKGTGSWLLKKSQYVQWRNSSVSSVLWLHGIRMFSASCVHESLLKDIQQGQGRLASCKLQTFFTKFIFTDITRSTVIAQLLSDHSVFANAAPIAYFYCQRNTAEPQRSDPTEVFRAILKQLLCCNPRWYEESFTANNYRARKFEAELEGCEVSSLDLFETTDQIIQIASVMPVTILIDALDECRSDQRHELLRALDLLLEKSAHLVKIFVSSRDDIDIVLRLKNHPNIYISINDNTDDIHEYIQYEVQKAQSDRRLLNGAISPELARLVTEKLAAKAGGMYVSFHKIFDT